MKKTIVFLIISAAFFCSRSDGRMHCDDEKLPAMPKEENTLLKNKPKQLSETLCNKLIQNPGENKELIKQCIKDHRSHFNWYDGDETSIEKYVDFCKKFPKLENSCADSKNSIQLIKRLTYYCWTLSDIAESNNELIFNEDVKISPEDWKYISDIDNVNLPSCLSQITSDELPYVESEEKGKNPNEKFVNLRVLKQYKQYLGEKKSYCNCGEAIGFDLIYDEYDDTIGEDEDYAYRKYKFLDKICMQRNKKYFWTKEQLDAIREFGKDPEQVKYYKINHKFLINFFTVANVLASKRWLSNDPFYKNSKWPVKYVFDTTLVDINTGFGVPFVENMFYKWHTDGCTIFDTTKVDVVAKAIFYNFSVDLFEQFIKITDDIPLSMFRYPFNIWECRKYVIDAFFDYNREDKLENIRIENYQYRGRDIESLNEHLNLFLQLRPEGSFCDEFSFDISRFLDVYYSYWRPIEQAEISKLLTSAIKNKVNLENVTECLKFCSAIEKQLIKKNFFNYELITNNKFGLEEILDFENYEFKYFRERLFRNKEIYDLCEEHENPDTDLITKLLEMLFTEQERDYLFRYTVPKDEKTENT